MKRKRADVKDSEQLDNMGMISCMALSPYETKLLKFMSRYEMIHSVCRIICPYIFQRLNLKNIEKDKIK